MKFLAGILIIGAIVAKMCLFVVSEGEQAIITQFGDPIGDPITEAGLHFKVPFLHEARYVDKRILSWDGFPNQIPTKDKKYISVDTTARWRIVDALKFIQTVRNETGAKTRLDAILDSATRDVVSNHNLVEAVRNSNSIFKSIEEKKKKVEEDKKAGNAEVEEDTTGEIESITKGRESLSDMISAAADKELKAFGIKLIDVQLRRISYERTVEAKVYDRMISERQRVAQKIRSIGQGEKAKIEGRMERDLQKIKSESYKQVQMIKGQGEAKAAAIYAKSLSKSPKFYEFIQTMDLYKDIFNEDTKFLLTSDSELLKYLKSGN
jgi:membrane protease subunit HflC